MSTPYINSAHVEEKNTSISKVRADSEAELRGADNVMYVRSVSQEESRQESEQTLMRFQNQLKTSEDMQDQSFLNQNIKTLATQSLHSDKNSRDLTLLPSAKPNFVETSQPQETLARQPEVQATAPAEVLLTPNAPAQSAAQAATALTTHSASQPKDDFPVKSTTSPVNSPAELSTKPPSVSSDAILTHDTYIADERVNQDHTLNETILDMGDMVATQHTSLPTTDALIRAQIAKVDGEVALVFSSANSTQKQTPQTEHIKETIHAQLQITQKNSALGEAKIDIEVSNNELKINIKPGLENGKAFDAQVLTDLRSMLEQKYPNYLIHLALDKENTAPSPLNDIRSLDKKSDHQEQQNDDSRHRQQDQKQNDDDRDD